MTVEDADELIPFQDVRIIKATGPALLCGIADKRVWLPRVHISGKLWCSGDRGKLFVRRWVALDRGLISALAPVNVSSMGRTKDILHAEPRPTHPQDDGVVRRAPGTRARTRGSATLAGLSSTPAGLELAHATSRPPVASLTDRRRDRTGLVP